MMSRSLILWFGIIVIATPVYGEDAEVAKQKTHAEESLKKAHPGQRAATETAHLYLLGAAPEARLKSLAAILEKQYTAAVKALEFEPSNPPWPGKLTVFVLADQAELKSFIRQIEKRSPLPEETGSAVWRSETPHLAIAIPAAKEPALEVSAGQQLTTALLYSRARSQDVPDWLLNGFAKATANQGSPAAPRKRHIAKLNVPATAAWNPDVPAEPRGLIAASVAEYLIYGKAVKVPALLGAFRRGEGQDSEKPTMDAFKDLELSPEKLEYGWRQWLAKP